MRSTTINSYLYTQFADDDNLQAFVGSYNAATQTYVDWFNTVGLPYYPGLSGDLLNWVLLGLYGLPRTTLESAVSNAIGPLNTVTLNTLPLNTLIAPTTTYYALTDDVFKRIMTWNFYKGDGKRFCMRWLKRRVMRFLVGVNGTDPQPWDEGFVVGAENTQAISVQVEDYVLTVSINQTLLSSLVQLTPGILSLFQVVFTSPGVLDLPAQYSYVCDI